MGVDRPIDITADERKTVLALLRRHLPGSAAWVYGSRAKWMSRPQSDLDLVVFATPAQQPQIGDLREAFEESNLPFRVDLFVWDDVPESFRKQIEAEHVVLARTVTRQRDEGWEKVPLGNLVDIYDGPHATPKKTSEGPIFLGISNLASGRLDLQQTEHLSENDYPRWTRRVTPTPNDIVFSYETRLGQAALIPRGLRACLGRRMGLLRPRNGAVDARFLLYAFLGKGFQETLRSRTIHGSTVDRIPLIDMASFPIDVPRAIADQRAIAHILGTLDDKIELNRRMNATLEALALALFKSWFVDFDPVRAKMEGRDPGLPKDIADLFPDRLVDSELGEIPEEWTVGTLGDIAHSSGMGVEPSAVDPDTPYIGLEHMPRRSVALTDWGSVGSVSSNKSSFSKGDVLFGKLRPYFHKVGIAPLNGVCSTDIVVLTARMPELAAYVLACVSSPEFVSYANQTSTGTKMPRTSWRLMGRYDLCRPAEPLVRIFQRVVCPMLERIVTNIHESRALGTLRDALLPKLVSGELRAPLVDRQRGERPNG